MARPLGDAPDMQMKMKTEAPNPLRCCLGDRSVESGVREAAGDATSALYLPGHAGCRGSVVCLGCCDRRPHWGA